jgi:LysR family cys regulon transcriptional activator
MKLQQLRYLSEIARRDLNVSEAAQALHTSQPGVSKQIRALEVELGIDVFVRHGKRLVAVTEPGKAVIAISERILAEAANLKRAGEEFANDQVGTLTVAATHTQARYALPKAVAAFKRRYPQVALHIHQGNPTQICEQVAAGEADLCVATEMVDRFPTLVSLPVYQWNRCVVVPPKHPLLKGNLTLEKLADYPIVTYDFAFANRTLVQKAFESRGLAPHIVLSAQDSDVIKTYVELGLGVGILAKMAFDRQRDRALRAIDASHLFESSTTRLGIKRGAYLRRYAYDFIATFAPQLPRPLVERVVQGNEGSRYSFNSGSGWKFRAAARTEFPP